MTKYIREFRTALVATLVLAVLVCGVYPMLVFGLAQGLFHEKANGSLIIRNGKVMGSSLIAQRFTGSQYFHPRPSAAGAGYDPLSSGGSNLGPLSRELVHTIRQRAVSYRMENNLKPDAAIPADSVTASASGLDPHISSYNALLQAPRVARARAMSEDVVRRIIAAHTLGRDLGIFGEPRVNILMLNFDLDRSR